jgi:perosamine synthetase
MIAKSTPFLMPQDAVVSWGSLSVRRTRPRVSAGEENPTRWSFFLARNAIFHGLRALNISRGSGVLVPAYICKAAVEPIVAYGAEPIFYEVRRDGVPVLEDIEHKLSNRVQAILAVHYFGFSQDLTLLKEFCRQRKLKLIEDCAHVLPCPGNGPVGMYGDISVFSWRKFFPVYDGGELQLNLPVRDFAVQWLPENLSFSARVVKRVLDHRAEHGKGIAAKILSTISAFANGARDRLSANGSAPAAAQQGPADSRSASFDQALLNQPMSRFSRWLLSHSDREEVATLRRRNYHFLESELRALPGVTPLHQELPPGVCPWVFPVFVGGVANSHIALRARGIPAVAWEGVRPEGVHAPSFPSADFLYENLTFLPVHQSLAQSDLERIVDAVKAMIRSRP